MNVNQIQKNWSKDNGILRNSWIHPTTMYVLFLIHACSGRQHVQVEAPEPLMDTLELQVSKREDTPQQLLWNGNKAETVKYLENGEYKLEVRTLLINDTLDIPDLKIYVTPVIKRQELNFYKAGRKIKSHILAIDQKIFISKNVENLRAPSIPMYEFCLLEGKEAFYMAGGSDFCYTGHCPEFVGIYSMEGSVILETISTQGLLSKRYMKLIDFCNTYQVKLNDPVKCIDTQEYRKFDYPIIEE